MGSMAIVSGRYSDSSTVTATSEDANFPITNLLKLQPTDVWESDTLTTVSVDIDLGTKRTINLVALLFHNLTAAGTIQVEAADTQGGLAAAPDDTGALSAWTQDAPSTSTWHDTNDDADRWAFPRNHFMHFLDTPFARRWFRLSLVDAGNPDSVFRAGRLFLDNAWLPKVKFGQLSYSIIGRSTKRVTSGGALIPLPKPAFPRVQTIFQSGDDEELFANSDELARLQRDSDAVLVVGDRTAGPFRHKKLVYGLMTLGQPLSLPNWQRFEQRFTVDGII